MAWRNQDRVIDELKGQRLFIESTDLTERAIVFDVLEELGFEVSEDTFRYGNDASAYKHIGIDSHSRSVNAWLDARDVFCSIEVVSPTRFFDLLYGTGTDMEEESVGSCVELPELSSFWA